MTRKQKNDLVVERDILQGGVSLAIAMNSEPSAEDIDRISDIDDLLEPDRRRYVRYRDLKSQKLDKNQAIK